MTNRELLPRIAAGIAVASGALAVAAGCAHHGAPTAGAPPAAASPTATAANAPFQPYTLINTPAPVTPATTHKHRYLRIISKDGETYLADPDGRSYAAGRDQSGRIYPVYHDSATNQYYPLYYDRQSDQYYRVLHADDGGYYRSYVGEPQSRFYETSDTYDSDVPPPQDCPVVTDTSYADNDNGDYDNGDYDNGGYENYAPVVYEHHNDAWLWSIPVIVGAYLLLSNHHDYNPQPVYYVQPGYQQPIIVERTDIINNIYAPVTIYQGGQRVTYSETVSPPVGHSPVFLGAPPRQPYSHDPRVAGNTVHIWRPTGFVVTKVPPTARAVPITSLHFAAHQPPAVPIAVAATPRIQPRPSELPGPHAPAAVPRPVTYANRPHPVGFNRVNTANGPAQLPLARPTPAAPTVAAKHPGGLHRAMPIRRVAAHIATHPAVPSPVRPTIATAPHPVNRTITRPNPVVMRPARNPYVRRAPIATRQPHPVLGTRPAHANPAPSFAPRTTAAQMQPINRTAPPRPAAQPRPAFRNASAPNPPPARRAAPRATHPVPAQPQAFSHPSVKPPVRKPAPAAKPQPPKPGADSQSHTNQ